MLYNSPSPKQGWNVLVSPQMFYSFHFWNQLIDSRSHLYITLFCFLKNNFVSYLKSLYSSMIHAQHYLNHLPLHKEILICVLNKTGVGKSGRSELSSRTSLQPRICLNRGRIQNVGLLCSNITDIIWL